MFSIFVCTALPENKSSSCAKYDDELIKSALFFSLFIEKIKLLSTSTFSLNFLTRLLLYN